MARVDGDTKITRDEGELAEAFWITRENIDEIQSTISLTKTMINNFKKYGFDLKSRDA